MSIIRCPGTVVSDANGVALCQDGSGLALAWTVEPSFDISQIDPAVAGELFSIGFILYGTAWAIGKGAAMVVNAIKLL